MPVGGQGSYPSLNTIANLVRTLVNDDQAGATGTPGEGQILTDSSVTLQNLMNSAIRDTYRDCRIMNQRALIKDNYILLGLPPVNSSLGAGVMNPSVQVAIQFAGYFDGLQMWPNLTLPSDMILPLEMWERQSGTTNPYAPMRQSTTAIAPVNQGPWLSTWEWRTDGIWMRGAIQPRDVRLRYVCTFADLAAPGIDWDTTYVPIMDCQDAVADKITVRYAARLGGAALADAMQAAKTSIFKLRQQVCLSRQMNDYQRPIYGQGVAGVSGDAGRYLY